MNHRARASHSKVMQPIAAFVVIVALAVGVLKSGVTAHAQAASNFVAGDAVVVNTDGLLLRTTATTAADAVTTLPDGTWATVAAGPVSADGYTWYELDVDGTTGWSAGEYLALATDAGDLPAGTVVTVNTDAINLRDAAGLSGSVLAVLDGGVSASVVAGPESADGYDWYELDANGVTGWAVRDYLAFATGSDTFAAGATAIVNTDALTLRDAAGLDGTVVDSLPGGTTVTIVSGPTDAGGYSWYQVSTDLGDGWVAGEFLQSA